MDILKNPKYKKIVTLIFILVILVTLNCLRYKNTASKTYDKSVVKWYKDNWTGVVWFSGYAIDKTATHPVGYTGEAYKKVVMTSKILTMAWYVFVAIDIFLIIYLFNKKRKGDLEI